MTEQAFELDQVVWVRTGEKHEEPGTVVEVGCAPDSSSEGTSERILVRLHVSGYKLVCDPALLRPLKEDDSGGQRRTSRRLTTTTLRRSVITPSPKTNPFLEEEDADDKKPAAKRKEKEAEAALEDTDTSSDEETSSPHFKRTKRSVASSASFESSKPAVKLPSRSFAVAIREDSKASDDDAQETKNLFVPKLPSKAAAAALVQDDSVPSSEPDDDNAADDDDDDDDDDDRPFSVEYSATSRATCRRCDECILKGSLRVSHVPLFRGKPGFRVYRHLECAVFSEDIHRAEDVGGWDKLSTDDYEALALRVEESKLEIEKENEELDPDELIPVAFQGETRKLPPGLVAQLLPFQVEGLSWMYHQEVHVPAIRGGILADEMGMGKTIQALATILDNRPVLQHCKHGAKHLSTLPDFELRRREEDMWAASAKDWKHEMEMNNVPKKILPKKFGAARTGTLVVCPLIALSQWKAEIEKFGEPGCLTVGIYHGPNRASEMPAEMIQKFDIVLTTYQVLEQDFRKMVSPNKVICPNCSGKFKIDKLRVHLKYFCGEAAQRTEAQSRQQRGEDRDRPGSRGQNRGNSKKKKPPMTKTNSKLSTATVVKKKASVQVKRIKEYDSDSDLSVDQDVADQISSTQPGRRPSRAAAQTASKKLSLSVKDWGSKISMTKRRAVDSDDDSNFSSGSESESSDGGNGSSEDEPLVDLRVLKKKTASSLIAIAKRRQAEALEAAKKKKPGKGQKKPAKKKMTAPRGKDKKFDSDSSSDESVAGNEGDPMDGIDMEELMDEAMAGSRFSVLHSFCWWRVILDEAHFIKSRSSQTAAAAFALTSIHRWCLSGTPLQNRVGELYSLIRFLRIDPMAHYCCRQKDCSCKSIHYRMRLGRCLDCGHPGPMHYSHFNKFVLNPIQRDGYSGDGRRAMFLLRDSVLNTCLLRRTKQNRSADMNLPPRLVTIRSVRLHPVEEDFYEALYTQTKSRFDHYVAEGTLLNNYAHIFDLLTKMRQAVDHPYLIVHSKMNAVRQAGQKAAAVANGTVDCAMCHEPPTEGVVSSCCGGGFCRSCVIEYLTGAGGENTPCPSCSAPFSIDLNQASSAELVDDGTLAVPSPGVGVSSWSAFVPSLKEMLHVQTGSILRRINLAEFATSTKIEVLVQELIEMRTQRPGSKALVFSQFVNMLDLVRWRLHSDPCLGEMGLGVRILHGGMDVKSRDAALKDFREESSCRVLLMSLKAAGVALNLTVASECFLLDLWWNPAAELQAIDRCHRLGQYRPIRAVRFVAEGTVEERVLQLQDKKRLVFDGTVGRDAGSLKLLTVDDMKALFA